MRLIDVLEKAPIGARVFHRSMGEGVTGVVTHKTEKDFVLELSNGHALVERMESTDASWSLSLERKKVKLKAYFIFQGDSYQQQFLKENEHPTDLTKWIRCEDDDREIEIYE